MSKSWLQPNGICSAVIYLPSHDPGVERNKSMGVELLVKTMRSEDTFLMSLLFASGHLR